MHTFSEFLLRRLLLACAAPVLVSYFTYFVLNNPVDMRLLGASVEGDALPAEGAWRDLVPRTRVKELAGSTLRVEGDSLRAAGRITHVRLETYPDGGANRLRVVGRAG